MKTIKIIYKIIECILIAILFILLIISITFMVKKYIFKQELPTVFGSSYSIVVSGSMEPTLSINDLVIIKEYDSYAVNDIVTYKSGSKFVTHRIIEVVEGGFITKGDANNGNDPIVSASNIKGKIVFIIPKIGNFIEWLKTPIGLITMLIIVFMLLTIPYIINKYRKEK